MTVVAALGAVLLVVVWAALDHGDDGIDYPLQRLADRKATAARIDPGVSGVRS